MKTRQAPAAPGAMGHGVRGALARLRRHSIRPMTMPLPQMMAMPSQVSASGKCPHTSQPTAVALTIYKYTKGASVDAAALR